LDIYWLSQIKSSEQSVVGDRCSLLSQLLQQGCPIMPGFVLGNDLFREMLDSLPDLEYSLADLPSSDLDTDDYRILQLLARRSRQIIQDAAFPSQWQEQIFAAARQLNSSTLSLQPCLTIPYQQHFGDRSLWRSHTCFLDPEALTLAIKRVWQEVFTAKSLFYWHRSGLKIEQITIAILIQPLKPARASGTIEVDSETLRIFATWGLISSLRWGDVKPDEYQIDRAKEIILHRHLGYHNWAYRPRSPSEAILEDCLESYLVEESDAVSHVLDDAAIAKLRELTDTVLRYQPGIQYLEWTLPEVEASLTVEPGFLVTQFNYRPLAVNYSRIFTSGELSDPALNPLLSGMAAAPGSVTATTLVIPDLDDNSQEIIPDCILVTHSIAPHHLSLLSQVGGIITELGGITSHGAILARELKIPAIVNAVDATKILPSQAKIFIDGATGKVYRAKDIRLLFTQNPRAMMLHYPIATKLMVNLSQSSAIAETANLPVDGVGLLRSELMLAELLTFQSPENWQHPEWRSQLLGTLINSLRQFISAFVPRPVFYRSIDWYARSSDNSIVGERGTYSYLLNSTLFDLELEAIAALLAEGYTNLNLILPFVRSVEEFKFCRRHLEERGITGYPFFQLWIMAEVPSAIFLLPEYIEAGVQGIAIGTNDLTQLLLGVDRERSHFSSRGLDARHPASLKAIAQLIQTARDHRIPCSICGQAPVQYPELIDQFVEWGITSISVEAEAVTTTYQAIARAEKRLMLKH
jgi:pyruvate, water dikinase